MSRSVRSRSTSPPSTNEWPAAASARAMGRPLPKWSLKATRMSTPSAARAAGLRVAGTLASAMIPYGRQTIEDDDVAAVVEALRGDWLTQGPRVAAFEAAVAEACAAPHAVAFSSGTAALHAACLAADLGPGDELVTSA